MDAFLIIIICIMAFVLTVINVYVLVRSFELALVRVSDNVMSPPSHRFTSRFGRHCAERCF
jgi:hypothetical protein